jgi:hypothetical protein
VIPFERFMERVGLTTMSLMRSDPWWRRALGTVLGALAVCAMLPLLAWWQLFGRKPWQ